MNPSEWLALAGLLRIMMGADGHVSLREHRFVGKLASDLGPELWTYLAKAEVELPSEDAVRRAAARVAKPESRARIRAILEALAESDGVVLEEQELLDWLDEAWASGAGDQ